MTKKDYILIAGVIKEQQSKSPISYKPLVEKLSDALKIENPLFDREKFLRACGVEQE